jgi:hypothetical protein
MNVTISSYKILAAIIFMGLFSVKKRCGLKPGKEYVHGKMIIHLELRLI